MTKYGSIPAVVCEDVLLDNKESMLYLYLPISLVGQKQYYIPEQLWKFQHIFDIVKEDVGGSIWENSNIYVTVKAMFVSGNCTGQRPGWHSDGFMTDDINYLCSDKEPTEFYVGPNINLSQDHEISLLEMEKHCEQWPTTIYGRNTLLRLDQSVLHKPCDSMDTGFRNFIKVSVSRHIYALEGNSINYIPEIFDFTSQWDYTPRGASRNCPVTKENT